jgi:hypothetical protein
MAGNVKDIDHGWNSIVREFSKAKQPFVKIGVLSDAPKDKKTKANLASIAAFNEFGTSDIPSRPFMAQTFDLNVFEVKSFIQNECGKILDLKQTIPGALSKIGLFYQAKTQQQITQGKFAPNSPLTIKLKGSSKPLIDTGRLRQSISHEVVIK